MHAQSGLLLDRLHRHEAHVRLPRRRADRLGIVGVVLSALAKRLHELGSNDAHGVPLAR